MQKLSLKQRLVRYLKNHPGWHASIALQKLTLEYNAGTGKTATRRLQEAVEEGVLEVSYVRGNAQYRFKAETPLKTPYNALQAPSKYLQGPELEAALTQMELYAKSIGL